MKNISTRPAVMQDIDFIFSFVSALTNELYDLEWFKKCFESCLNAPNTYYLIATCNDVNVGYISCHGQKILHHCGLVFEIQEMFVLPEFRNLGVGKKLLMKLEEQLATENYVLLEVTSNMKRLDAHRFYETNGFTRSSYKFKKTKV